MRIVGLVLTYGEVTTKAAVDSLRPWVDEVRVAVDDRTPEGFEHTLDAPALRHTWTDHTARTINELIKKLSDFHFIAHLDADEILTGGENLRKVCEDATGVDVVRVPRRHWIDMGMKHQYHLWWPDAQFRLFRPNFRLRGRVHPQPAWAYRVANTDKLMIEHFNRALRTEEDWAKINAFYERLAAMPDDEYDPFA